jgi:hypothetical protein
LALTVKFGGEQTDPRRVTVKAGKRTHQSRREHVIGDPENRNRQRRLLCGANSRISGGQDDINAGFDQLRGKF